MYRVRISISHSFDYFSDFPPKVIFNIEKQVEIRHHQYDIHKYELEVLGNKVISNVILLQVEVNHYRYISDLQEYQKHENPVGEATTPYNPLYSLCY